ncbi:MAG: DUF2334 domain-containing protein [Nanoarchaeota archaeon]
MGYKMMKKKKFVKKILISIVTLAVLFGLVFIFYINQSKFGELSIKEVDIYLLSLIKTNPDSVYTDKVIDYHDQIPICDSKNNKTIILRLDDVKAWQYYDVTANITDLILSKNMTITLGVIPQDIEKDTRLFLPWINEVKNNPNVEIALHGYLHEVSEFKNLNESEASYRLMKGNELLLKYAGIIPVTFIPPENLYSEGTVKALSKNGFKVLSAGDIYNHPNYFRINDELVFAGKSAQTYDFYHSNFEPAEKVIQECNDSLKLTGVCVVVIHPQDYLTSDRRHIDEERYKEFVNVLTGLDELDAEFRNYRDIVNCI